MYHWDSAMHKYLQDLKVSREAGVLLCYVLYELGIDTGELLSKAYNCRHSKWKRDTKAHTNEIIENMSGIQI